MSSAVRPLPGAPAAEPAPAPVDVVFAFFRVDWRASRERGSRFAQDRLFERLLVDERVGRLVVGNAHRSVAGRARRLLRGGAAPDAVMVEATRLRREDPGGVGGLRRMYARYDRSLAGAAARAGLEAPVAITSNPFAAAFCDFGEARAVTYYATDDWTAHHGHARWRRAHEVAQREIAARGRRVCAVSGELASRLAPAGAALVLPNGVAPEEWVRIGPPPAWLAGLPRPLLLYAGTLDSRIDAGLVREVAARFRSGSVVLLGTVADRDHLRRLQDSPNVVVHGPVGRAELAAAVHAADACLLPHAVTALTKAMSPLKVYEYLAAGRPVAAVRLPPLEGLGDRVRIAPAEGFTDAVADALADGPAEEDARRRFIAENSWARRHEQLLDFALA